LWNGSNRAQNRFIERTGSGARGTQDEDGRGRSREAGQTRQSTKHLAGTVWA